MRILQAIHQFPPHSSQGAEVYCHQLSATLARTDDVAVFHISVTRPRRPRRLVRSTLDGISVFHCADDAEYARVTSWPNQFLTRQFEAVLREFRPDVVHFHNYLSLADDLVTRARAAGAAVVYTLHDFGLICPNALLLTTDGRLCGKTDGAFFQDCCPELVRTARGGPPLLRSRLPSLARWSRFGNQMAGTSGAVVRAGVAVVERIAGAPARTAIAPKRAVYQSHTRRIFDDAHLFLAPSEFLRSRHVACGLPPHKVEYLRYGIRTFAARAPTPSAGRVRFGYIGALHAHKGIELLIAALAGLEGRAELHIYGSAFGSPITSRFVERVTAAAASHVVFHGPYENAAIAEILASLDAVVVPSIWYENSPLTIQEAFVGRVPVITADQGGMAELVRHDVDGLHFRLGDAADLRRVMQTVVDDPGLLPRLRLNIPPVPHIEGQTEKVRARYEALLTAR